MPGAGPAPALQHCQGGRRPRAPAAANAPGGDASFDRDTPRRRGLQLGTDAVLLGALAVGLTEARDLVLERTAPAR
ncbi:hypothetical protein OHA72_46630 [Dactylosporangium sp. NBC_01737]|uniref:hypothetical protein n=1 Tax=Dactylosporangium sp. NBC_01737 TaxID=2975959 RepID=UPI002E10E25A|nr:hypothetical protein OHA72_46630 [Dactylosporangium sp. NBC_01737]